MTPLPARWTRAWWREGFIDPLIRNERQPFLRVYSVVMVLVLVLGSIVAIVAGLAGW